VACHNKLEASPKRDWRVGDVRGVVEVSQPVDSQMLMAQDGLNRMSGTLVSMGGLAMVGLALVIGRFRHINQELKIQVQEQTAELHRLANLDCLTQVANRRQFDQNLVLEWNRLRCQHLPLSLLLCDVDYFKHYNDTYGHQAGDACLQMVARTLTDVVQRSGNLVARYGGEEFVIILPNTDQAGAVHVAQAILTAIRELEIPHESSEVSASVTLSVGIATQVPSDRHLPSHMVQWADQALYQAKAQGRNGFGVQEIPPLS
jgi:diguanylate cyclase (GGDEF)-like protein